MVRLRGLVGRVKFQGLKVISSDLQEGEEIVKFINQEIEELRRSQGTRLRKVKWLLHLRGGEEPVSDERRSPPRGYGQG